MSRSYKKEPVCTSHQSLKEYKQLYNRRYRRALKQGRYDDYIQHKGNINRKIENFTLVADSYTHWRTFLKHQEYYHAYQIRWTRPWVCRLTPEESKLFWLKYYHRK